MSFDLVRPEEKTEIEAFLRADADLHMYEIGDLDPFFWPRTRWIGAARAGELAALAMVYADPNGHETLLLLERRDRAAAEWLAAHEALPRDCYSHLSPGLAELRPVPKRARGTYAKMSLGSAPEVDTTGVIRLAPEHLDEVRAFYAHAYPDNWFEATMLETGCYRGFRNGSGQLACVAGVHVYAPDQGVAALGNIATAPEARNQGLGKRVTGALCRDLVGEGIRVGLNVAVENASAIACYRALGFEDTATYEEWAFGDWSR